MTRILHIIPSLGVGGTEKILLEICRGLDRSRFEHEVLSLKSGGQAAEALTSEGIPVSPLDSPDGFWPGLLDLPRLFFDLSRRIRDRRPDVVHTWLTRANLIGRLAARLVGSRHVVSSLRVMEKEKIYHLWAERFTHFLCEAVTVNCTALRDFAARELSIPPEKIRLIFNGIRPVEREPSYHRRGAEGSFAVGTMGRLHKQKGIDIFLEAMPSVLEKYSKCTFEIAGDGPEKKNLAALSEKLGIQDRVRFAGTVPSIQFLSGLDVFVLASRWEGMPNVVLEAMALGKPVAAAAVGGVTDLIENGIDGLIFAPGSPSSCATEILRLLESGPLRRNLGDSAKKIVSEKFTMAAMLTAHASLYESIVSGP